MLKSNRPSSGSAQQMSGGCMMLFGLPFILGGLAAGWFLYYPAMSDWWSARGWEEVPCWIETTDLKTTRGSKGGSTQQVTATYRYEYAGRTYHSDEVSFYGGSDNIGDFQQRAHAQIRAHAGQERAFCCYVNPARPEQAVLFRDLRWGLLLLLSVFPLVFPLVGFGVSIGGWRATRRARLEKNLAARHPAEPWRWKPEWADGAVQATPDALLLFMAFACWILLVQGPLALAILVSGELSRSLLPALGLLPTLLLLIPLSAAWRRVKTRRVMGRPRLLLKDTPLKPGHTLTGDLLLGHMLSPLDTLEVRVLCERLTTRRQGRGTSTTAETLWEHVAEVPATEARRDIGGVALPLRIELPDHLPCAVIGSAQDTAVWRMEVSSPQGGKPAVLTLPVFRSAGETHSAEQMAEAVAPMVPDTAQLVARLRSNGVLTEFDADGLLTLIDCPPGRFRAFSLFLILFGIIWSVIFIVLVMEGAPWPFRLIWGITAPLILGFGLWTWLHRRRVEITRDELRILSCIGPFYSWRESYAPRHLVGFMHDSNMKSGNQCYYRVRGETTFGKQPTLIDGITEAITAATLAQRLEDWRKRG